ncbi:LOW QUALITY PROTEIN: male-enhanced antigen 1 [Platichthys flesus]|uniref:LOW QUALITY PROTEIN: male-enhanced antigen 1 n=1 Tax=Platichthys flesus TaxID=8260 RepID=UPI002DB6375C|nr:LOW QUALITY PROTEIN: male-enhanced antigen 1 [Platichthys flesus]
MEVRSSAMGPERVLPSSEDELGENERTANGTLPLPSPGAMWSGGQGGGEEEEEEGEELELNGEGEEEGGYYYQPLNQDPESVHVIEDAEPSNAEQLQQRIEVMGLHLPEAPPLDSDEEDDPEGAASLRSRASIPMDADHVELVKRTMAAVALPSLGVPAWAQEISDDQWMDMVHHTLQSRHTAGTAGTLRLSHHRDISGP